MTIREEVKQMLQEHGESQVGLTINQIATRLLLIEATVRRTLGELRRAGQVRYGLDVTSGNRYVPTFVAVA
jgi:hypothetical protein